MSRALLDQETLPSTLDDDYESRGSAGFFTQANALLRKNASLQWRNKGSNIRLILYPVLMCLMLKGVQDLFDSISSVVDTPTEDCTQKYLVLMGDEQSTCPMPHPPRWPVLFQVPAPVYRAVRSNVSTSGEYQDLPLESCRRKGSCPVVMLVTGQNRSLAQRLGQNLFGSEPFGSNYSTLDPSPTGGMGRNLLGSKPIGSNSSTFNASQIEQSLKDFDDGRIFDPLQIGSNYILGTSEEPGSTNFMEPAFSIIADPMYMVQPKCSPDLDFSVTVHIEKDPFSQEVECVEGLQLWRDSSSDINNELFSGFQNGNPKKKINEFLAAYDFLNTDQKVFNVTVWYNGSYSDRSMFRILRAANAASNSYLQFFKGAHVKMLLDFVQETAKGVSGRPKTNYSTLLGPLFFVWVIQQLFPVMLVYIVYEKQNNLRMIMKMHGLGDRAYWIITYSYFLFISSFYMLSLVIFGSMIGLKSFTQNDYSVQFVFYFIHINLQIVFVFSVSTFFSNVKTASVVGYLYVFGTGLMGNFLFEGLIRDQSFPRDIIQIIEIIPGFSLYRGLYELSQYSFEVEYIGTPIVTWKDINADAQGMNALLKLMIAEWMILFLISCYLDQVVSNGSGVKKHPLWFLPCFNGRPKRNVERQEYGFLINMEKPDVSQEREKVDRVVREDNISHVIICHGLRKVYPERNGNPEKHAVRGLSLAIPRGECFGMLGPNGAGKTSFINMMTGLTVPTSGTAFVRGLDIRKDMDEVYTSMGVCPQHDLIWETLTGREHLLFYGRLKNLKGSLLVQAVEESLKRVNLSDKGTVLAGTYSGGMKRRLSVAISLIGNPRVAYLDEPSTGLDPASRKKLWDVLQSAKKDKAIILTTHSMEEAEFLCDRVGIFVDGMLQCLGNPRELKARYGGYYIFTMTTPLDQEEEVEKIVRRLSPRANKVYHLSGTQKFQLPKEDIKLANVFGEVEKAKSRLTIQAWGLSDATLEDVFIKVARGAQSDQELS